jgi:hypothetical protein
VAGRKTIFKKRGTSPDPALVSRDTTTARPMIGSLRAVMSAFVPISSALPPKADIHAVITDFRV